jgi:hypothetical protein
MSGAMTQISWENVKKLAAANSDLIGVGQRLAELAQKLPDDQAEILYEQIDRLAQTSELIAMAASSITTSSPS